MTNRWNGKLKGSAKANKPKRTTINGDGCLRSILRRASERISPKKNQKQKEKKVKRHASRHTFTQARTRQQGTQSVMTKFRTPSFNQGSVSKKIKISPAPNKNFDLILKICISNIWQRNKSAETKIEFKAKRRSNSDKNNNQKPTRTSQSNSFKFTQQGRSQET